MLILVYYIKHGERGAIAYAHAMMLGNFRCRIVQLVWRILRQGPPALAVVRVELALSHHTLSLGDGLVKTTR